MGASGYRLETAYASAQIPPAPAAKVRMKRRARDIA
jgi:hypothetical protein